MFSKTVVPLEMSTVLLNQNVFHGHYMVIRELCVWVIIHLHVFINQSLELHPKSSISFFVPLGVV